MWKDVINHTGTIVNLVKPKTLGLPKCTRELDYCTHNNLPIRVAFWTVYFLQIQNTKGGRNKWRRL